VDAQDFAPVATTAKNEPTTQNINQNGQVPAPEAMQADEFGSVKYFKKLVDENVPTEQ
jgi:hypothetical protein